MRDPADVIAVFLMRHAIPSHVAFRWAPDLLAALRDEYGTVTRIQGAHDLGTIIPVPVPEGSAS